jgi:hypothetical protein
LDESGNGGGDVDVVGIPGNCVVIVMVAIATSDDVI